MGELIYQWIDLVWLPIGWFAVHKHQRVKVMAFIITCILTLRTQAELLDSTGYDEGYLPLMHSPVFTRGLIVYSIIIMLFLILAYLSPRTQGIVFFTASITIYIFAFCVSMVLMLL